MDIPQPKHPFKHRQPVQMRFADIDVFGHVNNTVYMQYMDLGKLTYIRDTLGQLFDPRQKALVIASINCQFYNPTVYGEPIEVLTTIDSIGQHSLTLDQRVVNVATGDVKCACQTIMVGFDVRQQAKMAIPDDWRQRISAYEQRDVRLSPE